MSIRFITASLHYLPHENFAIPENFSSLVEAELAKHDVSFKEDYQDIALRYDMPPNMAKAMAKFFNEKFVCRLLSAIPSDDVLLDEDRPKWPRFIFIKTGIDHLIELDVAGKSIFVGDKIQLHKETSALANALGLNLAERDNYPGGKQKVAFNLIDLTWSTINSKLPLIVF